MLPTTFGETAKTRVTEVSPRNLHRELRKISRSIVLGIERKEFRFTANNRSIALGPLDVLRILTHYSGESDIEKIACRLLLREAYLCEKKSPLGSYALIHEIVTGGSDPLRKADQKSIKDMLDLLNESTLASAVLTGLQACGNRAQVFVEENSSEQTHVRLRGRSEFPVVSLPEFGTKIVLQECPIASFDGVIETVSEIHHILESHYESKKPLILLSRGMSTEVASVLVQNWRMGNLKVVPVTSRVDWTQEFVVRDVSACFSDDPLVHFREKKIELIESKDVEIDSGFLRFESNRALQDDPDMNIDVVEFHESRKKWHSNRSVTILLGGDLGDYRGILKDRLSTILRFIQFSKTNRIVRLQQTWCTADAVKSAKESASSLSNESSRIKIGVMKDEKLVQT